MGWFCFSNGVKTLNILLDTSQPQEHLVIVTKALEKGWRYTHLAIHFPDWKNQNNICGVGINQNLYNSIEKSVTIKTKKGFFGWEWVVQISPLKK